MDDKLGKEQIWAGGKVKCDLCGCEWIAVYNPECEKLECPNCRNMSYYEEIEIEKDG